MRVDISVDMEGVAHKSCVDEVVRGEHRYSRAKQLTTGEAHAAVAGAFEGGMTELMVKDV